MRQDQRNMLMGIDPGFNNLGLSLYMPATNELELYTLNYTEFLEILPGYKDAVYCIMENPADDSNAFGLAEEIMAIKVTGGKDIQSKIRKILKIAQNIGENKAASKLIYRNLLSMHIPTVTVKPSDRQRADKLNTHGELVDARFLSMPTKTTPKQFKMITGYKERSSEHARDAATLIYGRSISWVYTQSCILSQQFAKPVFLS